MRTAICFSGQIRPATYDCLDNIINNIIIPNNCDVFIHTWYDDQPYSILSDDKIDDDVYNMVLKKTNPINYQIQKQIKFDDRKYKHDHGIDPLGTWAIYSQQSMFYSIMKSNNMKCEYENENNFLYDVVIRIRFDYVVSDIIDFNNYDMSKINMSVYPMSDVVAFSNSKNMDYYTSLYNQLDLYHSFGNNNHMPENILMKHLGGKQLNHIPYGNDKILRTFTPEQIDESINRLRG